MSDSYTESLGGYTGPNTGRSAGGFLSGLTQILPTIGSVFTNVWNQVHPPTSAGSGGGVVNTAQQQEQQRQAAAQAAKTSYADKWQMGLLSAAVVLLGGGLLFTMVKHK